jgi:uncharacterized repeat protein (TIGR02543 family)
MKKALRFALLLSSSALLLAGCNNEQESKMGEEGTFFSSLLPSSEATPSSSAEEKTSSKEVHSSSSSKSSSSSSKSSSSQSKESSSESKSSSSGSGKSSSETKEETSSSEPAVNEYTITFDCKGGSEVASQTVKEGEKATKPEDPSYEGYTFGGWYRDEKLTKEFDFDTEITTDYTLYAKWIGEGESSSSEGGDDSGDDESSTGYWIYGSFCSWGKEGAIALEPNPNGATDLGMKLGVTFSADTAIKVTDFSDGYYGYHEGLSSDFKSDESGNIVIVADGTYDIYFNASKEVWISKVGSSGDDEGEKTYYITGSFCSWDLSKAIVMDDEAEGSDLAVKFDVSFSKGDAIKVTDGDKGWYGYRDELSGVANSGDNGNIVIKESGAYDVYLNESSLVWVEKKAIDSGDSSSEEQLSPEVSSEIVSEENESSAIEIEPSSSEEENVSEGGSDSLSQEGEILSSEEFSEDVSSEEASATPNYHGPDGSEFVDWYLLGQGSLWDDNSWSNEKGIRMFSNPNESDFACLLDVSFAKDDQFKFVSADRNTWLGYEFVDGWDDASNLGKNNFGAAEGGSNFVCNVAGTYNIYLNVKTENETSKNNVWICAAV